jgi:hypothetical protein
LAQQMLLTPVKRFHLEGNSIRSELVFDAMANVSNRFLLTMLAAKATRKLHRPNARIQETANEVLVRPVIPSPSKTSGPLGMYLPRRCAKRVEPLIQPRVRRI